MEEKIYTTVYEEYTNDERTWRPIARPSFDIDRFQNQLTDIGGVVNNIRRFRIRWAADDTKREENIQYVLESEHQQIKGYSWTKDGETHFESALNEDAVIPDDVIVTPVIDTYDIAIPRFVIEEYSEQFNMYQKAWFCESLSPISEQSGMVEVLSKYREPSEIDLEMARGVAKLRKELSHTDVKQGVAQNKTDANREKQHIAFERQGELAEIIEKAFRDDNEGGEYNAPSLPPNYINQYSRQLINQ